MCKKILSQISKFLSSGSLCFVFLFLGNGRVVLEWDANTESDLGGYKIYYGAVSQNYSSVIDVGLVSNYSFGNLEAGKNYYFSVTAYDTNAHESRFSDEVSLLDGSDGDNNPPNSIAIKKCYNFPNPFNPQKEITQIRYFLQKPELVTIKIYDDLGKCIQTIIENEYKSDGEHIEDSWDGKNRYDEIVQNSVYYCTIVTPSRKDVITIAVLN